MDRQIVYPGSIPLDTDLLQSQVNAMVALGYLAQAVLGTAAAADGLQAVARTPAAMTIDIQPGSITWFSTVDATAYGSLPANGAPVVKIGVNTASIPLTFAAPGSAGQSQAFLIEASFSEADASPVALPYYNAGNPAVSFSGPNNSGVPQNTQRLQSVAIQVKPGTPAASGSQVTPAADVGWYPLYVVTLNAGQASITQASIATHPQAPIIPWKLPQLDPGFSRMQTFPASGVFTPPIGCASVKVRMWGGGGGGGGSQGSNSGGSAGGGGGYAEAIVAVAPLVPIAVTVGGGGLAGNTAASNGTNGSASSFGPISATGGGAGGGSNGAFYPNGGNGGTGVGGSFMVVGTKGSTAFSVGAAVAVAVGGGTFGTGNTALNFVGGATTVNAGVFPGGGGNGGGLGGAGGAGAQGLVIIEY